MSFEVARKLALRSVGKPPFELKLGAYGATLFLLIAPEVPFVLQQLVLCCIHTVFDAVP